MQPRRFLFLSRCLEYGGAERQIVTLTKALHARGHDVTLAVFYAGGPLKADLAEAGVRLVSLDKSGTWDVFRFLFKWARLLRQYRPDVIHSYLIVPNLVALSAKLLRPRTRIVWGVRDAYRKINDRGALAAATFALQRVLAPLADLVITNSHAGARTVTALGFASKKLRVIPNGINTNRFRPDPVARQIVRSELHIAPGCVVIGIVGRFDSIKGHDVFLQGAARLLEDRRDVRFLVIGAGSAARESNLRAKAASLDIEPYVIWTGPRADIPAVLNGIDVLTSCSLSEGFSNVIAEALASGVPCVVTDVGDSALLVGDCGVTVPPGDPDALAAAWTELLDSKDLPPEYIQNRILERFTVDHLVSRTEEALCSLP